MDRNDEFSLMPVIGVFIALTVLVLTFGFAHPAHAALNLDAFTHDFQAQASETYSFTSGRTASFYSHTDDRGYGLRLGGVMDASDAASFASGLAFGGSSANLEHEAKLTTLLFNGTYDLPGFTRLVLRPYLLAGAGFAVYDSTSANFQPIERGTDVLPVFKLGGGFAFRMGEEMNLAFSYKAGFAGSATLVGHGTQDPAMQMVDVSLKYKF